MKQTIKYLIYTIYVVLSHYNVPYIEMNIQPAFKEILHIFEEYYKYNQSGGSESRSRIYQYMTINRDNSYDIIQSIMNAYAIDKINRHQTELGDKQMKEINKIFENKNRVQTTGGKKSHKAILYHNTENDKNIEYIITEILKGNHSKQIKSPEKIVINNQTEIAGNKEITKLINKLYKLHIKGDTKNAYKLMENIVIELLNIFNRLTLYTSKIEHINKNYVYRYKNLLQETFRLKDERDDCKHELDKLYHNNNKHKDNLYDEYDILSKIIPHDLLI